MNIFKMLPNLFRRYVDPHFGKPISELPMATNSEVKRKYRASKGQARKLVPFTQYERILKGMTNWQNSQWLRSGAPVLEDYDDMLAQATYYRLLPKGFKHES